MTAAAPSSRRWLFGPAPDLLLGCGILYGLTLLAFSLGGSELRQRQADFVLPLLFLAVGAPHYGATLLRVYEERAERRRYAFFSVWVTLAVFAAFLAGLVSPWVASWLLTIYLTWSPWHYTGQNYGVAVMFLRRRGVDLDGGLKRWIYASFILSYVLTFLVFHGPIDSSPSPEFYSGASGSFRSLGIPPAVHGVIFPAAAAAYLLALGVSAVGLARRGSLRDATPAALLALTQALWFSIPMVVRYWHIATGLEPFQWELRSFYFFWIALGHATQYLWITTYYARESRGWHGYGRYLLRALAAGAAVWTLPVFLFGPRFAGALPNAGEVALLVAACVNLHHFLLDGAIWKLRDGPIANILIRSVPTDDAPAPAGPGWGRRLVWTTASIGFALAATKYLVGDVLYPAAVNARDFAAARTWIRVYSWVADVNPEAERQVEASQEALAKMRRQQQMRLERSLGLMPDVAPYVHRARRLERAGSWEEALEQYEAALRLDPENVAVLRASARAALGLDAPARARDYLARAVDLQPWNPDLARELRGVQQLADAQGAP